jgi:hypothetical protein
LAEIYLFSLRLYQSLVSTLTALVSVLSASRH